MDENQQGAGSSVWNEARGKELGLTPPPWAKGNEAFGQGVVRNDSPVATGHFNAGPRLHKQKRGMLLQACQTAAQQLADWRHNPTNNEQSVPKVLVQNLLATRTNLLDWLLDSNDRGLYEECGYPNLITPLMYREMFDRESTAARVVSILPEESWALDPEIYEHEDEDKETPFEAGWNALKDELHLFHYFERVDVLSGIGSYGILLYGFDDGKELQEPVDGIADDGTPAWLNEKGEQIDGSTPAQHKLLYVRAFDESLVHIAKWVTDRNNPRYGQPEIYLVRFLDYSVVPAGQTVTDVVTHMVHWTRVIHIADNRKGSEVFGVPRMQHVFNRLLDVRKILSGSAEMFWKGAFPGYALEVLPELADAEIDVESVRKELDQYFNGLQRYMAVAGFKVNSLTPQISDPEKHLDAQLRNVAMSIGVPWRVFNGSEEAQLASKQDKKTWNGRLGRRQEKYMTPWIIRPAIDRLIAAGVLPPPEEKYKVLWPDFDSPSDLDNAQVALAKTQALSQYVAGGCEAVIVPLDYLTKFLNIPLDQAKAICEAAEEHQAEMLDEAMEQQQAAIEAAAAADSGRGQQNAGEGPVGDIDGGVAGGAGGAAGQGGGVTWKT